MGLTQDVWAAAPLYKVGRLVVHSTCTWNIVWHEACVLALFHRHGARKGAHSVY